MAQVGQACEKPGCRGFLKTYKTRPLSKIAFRKRWLECSECGHRPEENTMLIPLAFAPRRQSHRNSGNRGPKQQRIF